MQLKEIAAKDCAWILYEVVDDDGGGYLLTVMCGSFAVYALNLRLTREEFPDHPPDEASVDALARAVFHRPTEHWPNHVDVPDSAR